LDHVASIDTPLETQPAKGRRKMPSDKSSNKEPETPNSPDGKSKQSTDNSSELLTTPKGRKYRQMTRARSEKYGMDQDSFITFGPRKSGRKDEGSKREGPQDAPAALFNRRLHSPIKLLK
jgi:hypothetical protein